MEWSREIMAPYAATITFRVTSQGPFRVTVVTERAYKAAVAKNREKLDKEDILLAIDSKNTTYDGKVTLPAGSSWFIIENQTDKPAKIRLQCFLH
jgi:hypothetical protein